MIDPSDKELLRRAIAEVHKANAILNFVSDHLRDRYQLPVGASIDPSTGAIVLPPPENKRIGGQFGLWDVQSEVAVSGETA